MDGESYITLADIAGDRSRPTSNWRPSAGWANLFAGEGLIVKTHVLTYHNVLVMCLSSSLFHTA